MESPVRKRLTNVLSVIAWSLVALFCIVFSVTAVEFYFFLKADLVPSYARFLEWAVSHEYAFGANSGMLEGRPYWLTMPEPNKLALAVHTILGAGCLLLAPVQMARWVRKNKRVHRLLGRIYVGAGIVSMLAAMVYLSMTPLTRIFGGRPFAIGLWGVAIITLYTFVMAAVHAARREIW